MRNGSRSQLLSSLNSYHFTSFFPPTAVADILGEGDELVVGLGSLSERLPTTPPAKTRLAAESEVKKTKGSKQTVGQHPAKCLRCRPARPASNTPCDQGQAGEATCHESD